MLPKVLIHEPNKKKEKRIYEQVERLAAGRYEVSLLAEGELETNYDIILCPASQLLSCQKNSPEASILTWEQDFSVPLAISEIDNKIEDLLQQWRKRQRSLPDGKNTGLALVFCFDGSIRKSWVPNYLQALLNQGIQTIYLPIMPLYLVPDLEEQTVGPQLNNLLLSLDQVETGIPKQIGHYIYTHQLGYYTFRLSQQADDLITCPPHLLRKLLLALKDYVNSRSDTTLALVDCVGLGMETTIRLAQLCDILYIDAVGSETGAGRIARRELSKFLAAMPNSVNFRFLNEVKL